MTSAKFWVPPLVLLVLLGVAAKIKSFTVAILSFATWAAWMLYITLKRE